jgi:hypothetical protein
VVGVLIPSVVVIGAGAIAFATGQTYVTLSFRRGFVSGWAVRQPAADGSKRRRGRAERTDPDLEDFDLEATDEGQADAPAQDAAGGLPGQDGPPYGSDDERDDVFAAARPVDPTAADATAVYAPQPLPDDTGSYGVYGGPGHQQAGQGQTQDQYATTGQGYGYDYSGYGQQSYGYDTTGQQQYAGYAEPYPNAQNYDGTSYDSGYGGQQGYGQQGYGTQDPYAAGGYGGETPAGGVWVPQQRSEDSYGGQLPPEQSYPYQGDGQAQGHNQAQHGAGYDEQYRF